MFMMALFESERRLTCHCLFLQGIEKFKAAAKEVQGNIFSGQASSCPICLFVLHLLWFGAVVLCCMSGLFTETCFLLTWPSRNLAFYCLLQCWSIYSTFAFQKAIRKDFKFDNFQHCWCISITCPAIIKFFKLCCMKMFA